MNILLVFLEDHGVVLNMLNCLHASNVFVLGPTQTSPLSYSRRCRYSYIPVEEGDRFAEFINEFCEANNITTIVPTDMRSFFNLSRIQSQLEQKLFITENSKKLTLLHDKHLFYAFMRENAISTPHTDLINIEEDILRLPFHFPLIIKPFNLSGLRGVKRLNTYEELQRYIYSDEPYTSLPLLVQDYIDGIDIDVSIFAVKGTIVAYTIQQWCERGVLQFIDNKKALSLAQDIVSKLSFSGVAHFDMREERRTKRIYVLECNPRFWGSITASYMAGVDFISLGIDASFERGKTDTILHYKKDYFVLISVIHKVILQMKWKYISTLTIKNILDILSDPLPFLLTQLQIVFNHSKV